MSETVQILDENKAIEVISLSKKYKGNSNYSVASASFVVKPGEIHGFIGANGAGKTTTIKSIVGAYATFGGSINIFGHKNTTKQAKSFIGYIPEKADFPTGYSTLAYLSTIAVLRGVPAKEAKTFALNKLVDLGISEIAGRSPIKLSSGQKKKVLLIQALLHNPKVIIADEPAANLDPKARVEFFDTIKKLAREEKIAFFVSSHILDELEKHIDSLTILEAGKIMYSGSMKDLQHKRKAENGNRWGIKTADYDAITKVLDGIKVKWNRVDNMIEFEADNKNIIKIFSKLIEANAPIQSLASKGSDLSDIYQDFVKVGSLDLKGRG